MRDLMKEGFIEFTEKKSFISEDPIISINKGGRIGINKKAFKSYLSNYKYIKLFFNPKKKIIALRATNSEDQNTYSIKKNKGSETGYINSRSFFSYFGISMDKKKVKASWDKEAETFFVQI